MDLPVLKKLDLRGNQIVKIEHIPDLPELVDLNLDENQIADVKQISNLYPMSTITTLSLKGNPVAEEKGDDFKKEVIMQLIKQAEQPTEWQQLVTLNEDKLTKEDWTEARNDLAERIKQEEEEANQKKDGDGDADGDGDGDD